MTLIELFSRLSIPQEGKENVFSALPIPGYSNFRLGVNAQGAPVLLFSALIPSNKSGRKNFRLRYIQIDQNIECKITEDGNDTFRTLTAVTFTSSDNRLQEHFLRISEILIATLNPNPTQAQLLDAIDKFVEIFQALNETPTNTIQGLWSELFVIANSKDPKVLLNYWHNLPEEKFDFNSGAQKIEVKSTTTFERIHFFSSEQLNPPAETHVLIASIFVKQDSEGISAQSLINIIESKVKDNPTLVSKLNLVVSKTLGYSLDLCGKMKFNSSIAQDSLRFYDQKDISKIERVHIPAEVSEVCYRSDLSMIKNIKTAEGLGEPLFRHL